MTRYAYDVEQRVLVAAWGTGAGEIARTVASAPAWAAEEQMLALAQALGLLSQAAWRTYTHPASACADHEVNSEGWRRRHEREAFDEALKAVRKPNLPQDGGLLVEYSPVAESGHQVGRALHALGDPALTETISAEANAELLAVSQAELGDLTGRARQAVLLTREDASPVQVAAADALLQKDPWGWRALDTEIDPTAAAVAAAHWLQAAADVAGEAAGVAPADVVVEADNIEALPYETPTRTLQLMAEGASPHQAVTRLVRDAMQVAEGHIPDLSQLLAKVRDAEDLVQRYAHSDDATAKELRRIQLTPLDIHRPSPDLLEDLLTGIHACWLLYEEHAALDDLDEEPDEEEGGGATDVCSDPEAESDDTWLAQTREEFTALVRLEAEATRARLF